MQITEVRIKLAEGESTTPLAYATIIFDEVLVVRDLRLIQGTMRMFVSMPSRKIADRCLQCGSKNHLKARYCNKCGCQLAPDRTRINEEEKAKYYADVVHPLHPALRSQIEQAVFAAYVQELELSRQPGYVCRYDDRSDVFREAHSLLPLVNAS